MESSLSRNCSKSQSPEDRNPHITFSFSELGMRRVCASVLFAFLVVFKGYEICGYGPYSGEDPKHLGSSHCRPAATSPQEPWPKLLT